MHTRVSPIRKRRKHFECKVKNVFGRSLYQGVIIVSITTAVISSITLTLSILILGLLTSQKEMNGKDPKQASTLILVLVFTPMSIYQFATCALILFHIVKYGGSPFLCSLWSSSHVSILVVYGILFVTKACTSFFNDDHLVGCMALFAGITYEAVFIYFIVIVNSYLDTIDEDIYL